MSLILPKRQIITRRRALVGIGAGLCAPAIVRAQNIIGSGVYGDIKPHSAVAAYAGADKFLTSSAGFVSSYTTTSISLGAPSGKILLVGVYAYFSGATDAFTNVVSNASGTSLTKIGDDTGGVGGGSQYALYYTTAETNTSGTITVHCTGANMSIVTVVTGVVSGYVTATPTGFTYINYNGANPYNWAGSVTIPSNGVLAGGFYLSDATVTPTFTNGHISLDTNNHGSISGNQTFGLSDTTAGTYTPAMTLSAPFKGSAGVIATWD